MVWKSGTKGGITDEWRRQVMFYTQEACIKERQQEARKKHAYA